MMKWFLRALTVVLVGWMFLFGFKFETKFLRFSVNGWFKTYTLAELPTPEKQGE